MRTISNLIISALLILTATTIHAQVPDYIGKHISTPEDVAAINNVVEQFRTGIINKDGRQINALMLNSHVLFSSAPTPAQINTIREKYDPNFDGIFAGGLQDFCQFLSKEKGAVEEKFYNIKITQDDHTAWVMFDYEFQMEHQTQNYGVETWELAKDAHDQWKIISVVWSVHMAKS